MISVHFQGKPFNITVIQVYVPTTNAKEAKVESFCEELQELTELTPKKDVLFIIGDWNAKVGSQKTSFWGVSSRRSCRSFIEPFNFSFFSISVWGIDLDLL